MHKNYVTIRLRLQPHGSPVEYVTLFAGAVISLRQVMAVLSAVAVVVAVCTFILFWTAEERPTGVS